MDKKKVFMIMPFEENFFEMYEMLKIEFDQDYEFSNAGDEGNQQNIMRDIIEPIYKADIIIADLTGLNPNVMYELGIAHTFNKKTIVITQNELSQLPFDLKQYRAKDYTTHFKKFRNLIEYLRENMAGAINGSVLYGNPVNDFMNLANIEKNGWFERNEVVLRDDSDKGYLDFLAEIDEDTTFLANDIIEMTGEMNEMASGISICSNEIKCVNKNGGNGTASFIRKKTREAAKYIEKFASDLRVHNKTIASLWDKIERNTFGLLENQYSVKGNNKQALIKYLTSLIQMKKAISESSISVTGLKESMNHVMGLERNMTQAARFCVEDITLYLNISERISASIDKIIDKSKFVVGSLPTQEEARAITMVNEVEMNAESNS